MPSDLREGQIALAWLDDSTDLRTPIIVVPSRELREFFAFAATYIGSYSPISAFFQIIPLEFFTNLPRDPHPLHESTLKPFLGLCIAEAYTQLGGDGRRVSDITLQACHATQSSVGLSALHCNYSNDIVVQSLERWQAVRKLLRSESLRVPAARVADIWNLAIGGASERPYPNSSAERELITTLVRAAFSEDFANNPAGWISAAPVVDRNLLSTLSFGGTREERVSAFDRVVAAVRGSGAEDLRKEALIGFAAAQVAEGSFAYLGLLDQVAKELPLAPLWFGLFAGAHPKSDVLTTGECLGRRLERRARLQSMTSALAGADVSFDEFGMVSDEGRTRRLRTEQQTVLRVELFPGVIGLFRQQRDGRPETEARVSPDLTKEIKATVARLMVLADALEGVPAPSPASRSEPTLFPETQSSKTRPWPTVKPKRTRTTKK
jgi:hypothetical protein